MLTNSRQLSLAGLAIALLCGCHSSSKPDPLDFTTHSPRVVFHVKDMGKRLNLL